MNFLPKLPGYHFTDPTTKKYHLSHKCKVVNGYSSFVESDGLGIGNRPLDVDSVGYLDIDKTTRLDPSLIYGRTKSEDPPKFIPHHAIYANKCLTFRAFYKQYLPLSPNENFLVHYVNIHYFLEDDTITVIEPKVPNSGFLEGRIIRRRRIEKPCSNRYWHWKDLDININIDLQGITFYLVSCDYFTKEFMRSQGIDINCDDISVPNFNLEEATPKYHLYKRPSLITIESPYKIKYAGRDDILNFHCIWENELPGNHNKDIREFVLSYYLEDDTISVKELYKRNDGRDPFSKLLRRIKLPKHEENFFTALLEDKKDEVEYYGPENIIIGNSINVFGRKFLVVNCDAMTRYFYKNVLNIEQPDQVDWRQDSIKRNPFEEEIQTFNYKKAKQTIKYPKDELKFILNANKYLRYSADMVSAHPEDSGRKFIFSYSLADETIKIVELKQPNFGIMGGTFLSRQKIIKPNSDQYYTVSDLYIGAIVNVFKHLFRITGADLYVFNYVEQNKDKFPIHTYESLKKYTSDQGYVKSFDSTEYVTEIDKYDPCYVKKLEQEQLNGEIMVDVDPDAPTIECRYPILVEGQLQDKQCTHSKDLAILMRNSKYDEKRVNQEAIYKQDGENYFTEKHNKIECPVTGEPGLALHSAKKVSFAL